MPTQRLSDRGERAIRDDAMAYERLRGATVRAIAKRFGLSKSRVHQIVADVEIIGPPPRYGTVLVHLPGGGYGLAPGERLDPGITAYKVRDGKRVLPP